MAPHVSVMGLNAVFFMTPPQPGQIISLEAFSFPTVMVGSSRCKMNGVVRPASRPSAALSSWSAYRSAQARGIALCPKLPIPLMPVSIRTHLRFRAAHDKKAPGFPLGRPPSAGDVFPGFFLSGRKNGDSAPSSACRKRRRFRPPLPACHRREQPIRQNRGLNRAARRRPAHLTDYGRIPRASTSMNNDRN